jgi:acetyl esterase
MSENSIDALLAMLGDQLPTDVFEFRELFDGVISMLANQNLPEIGASHDEVLIREVDGHQLTADIHVPAGAGPHPVLVYLHGGGWVLGSPKSHRRLGHRFAEAGFLVFNIDYRLAPEHPFPGAFDDCVEAIRWVAANAASYGGDASRLAVGGDSAGGNLTAAAAAALADAADVDIKAILLLYGVFDFAEVGEGIDLIPGGAELLEMMVGAYIGHDRERLLTDPRVSPIHVAEKLPPAHIMCGTADALIADAQALCDKLASSGKEFEQAFYEDMPHGFSQMEEFFPDARRSIDSMVAFLNRYL